MLRVAFVLRSTDVNPEFFWFVHLRKRESNLKSESKCSLKKKREFNLDLRLDYSIRFSSWIYLSSSFRIFKRSFERIFERRKRKNIFRKKNILWKEKYFSKRKIFFERNIFRNEKYFSKEIFFEMKNISVRLISPYRVLCLYRVVFFVWYLSGGLWIKIKEQFPKILIKGFFGRI